MTRADKLKELTSRMRHLDHQFDPSAAHPKADRLLLEAIRVLTQYDPELHRPAQELLRTFEHLEKWYT